MFNYHFDEFTINKDSLFKNGTPVSIPPKELAVLHLLVTHTGEIITKDEIIANVWFGGCVSDESLARCIYVIRKTLEETTKNIFISTIYGKGYRFVKAVTKVSREKTATTESGVIADELTLAVFPFNMQSSDKSFIIFDYLMSQHEYFNSECGVTFCPSALTINSKNINAAFTDLRQAGVKYFITGNEIIANDVSIIRIELIDSATMAVLARRTVILSMDNTINLINVSRGIVRMLKRLNVASRPEKGAHPSSCASPFSDIDMFTLSFNDLVRKFDTQYDLSQQEFYFLTSRHALLEFIENPENAYITKKSLTMHSACWKATPLTRWRWRSKPFTEVTFLLARRSRCLKLP